MKHIALVLVFLTCLVLKATNAAGNQQAYQRAYPSNNNQNYNSSESNANAQSNAEYYNDARPYQGNAQESDQRQEQRQAIQNNNNITVGNPAYGHQSASQGGYVPPAVSYPPATYPPAVAYRNDGDASVLGHSDAYPRRYQRISIIPMIGGSWYSTRWNDHIRNAYTFGLALDVPITSNLSFEVEGGHAKYNISYSFHPPMLFKHDFNQYNLGGNMKVYLMRGVFQPYVGGGIMGVYYEGMSRGPLMPYQNYNQWIGSGQLMGGAEIALGEGLAIGGRAAYLMPLFNRPYTLDNGVSSAPGFEEAAAINTGYFKALATVRVSL